MEDRGSALGQGDAEETPRPQLTAFGLQAPARLMTPVFSPYGAIKAAVNRQQLGAESDGFTFTRIGYQATGEVVYEISVRCDNTPHCQYCECDSSHYATLTAEQVATLRKMLER